MSDNSENSVLTVFGLIFSVIFLLVYGCICQGFIIQHAWQWFITPTFSLAALTLKQAIGVSVFVSLFTLGDAKEKIEKAKNNEDDFITAFLAAIFFPWFVFGLVWLVHLFV